MKLESGLNVVYLRKRECVFVDGPPELKMDWV